MPYFRSAAGRAIAYSAAAEALALCRQIDNQQGVCWALNELADVTYAQGEVEAAAAMYEEGLALAQKHGNTRGVGGLLNSLGRVALRRGEIADAHHRFTEALTLQRKLGSLGDDIHIRLVSLRGRYGEIQAEASPAQQQRMGHVIAVANVGQLHAFQPSESFVQRHHVGKYLTWMIKIAERVDHRHGRVRRYFFEGRLSKSAHGDQIHPASEAARAIGRRLARPEPDFRASHKDHAATQLVHADFEGRPGSQAGLFKHQRQAFPRQQTMGSPAPMLAL